MKSLKEAKVGDTVRVVKLHGEGGGETPDHGHGADKGSGCADPQGGAFGRSDRSDCPRL